MGINRLLLFSNSQLMHTNFVAKWILFSPSKIYFGWIFLAMYPIFELGQKIYRNYQNDAVTNTSEQVFGNRIFEVFASTLILIQIYLMRRLLIIIQTDYICILLEDYDCFQILVINGWTLLWIYYFSRLFCKSKCILLPRTLWQLYHKSCHSLIIYHNVLISLFWHH